MHDLNRAKAARAEWVRIAAVLLCGCVSLWLYRAAIRLVPKITSAEPTGASEVFPWVKPVTRDTLDAIQHRTHGFWYSYDFMACCAGLFVIYGIMVWVAKGTASRRFAAAMAAAAGIYMAALICAPAMLSSDVYAYAHYGRLLAVDGVDAHGPGAMAEAGTNTSDPFSLDGYYDFVPSVYGPFWTLISAGLVKAGRDHVGLTVFLFRALEAAAALGSGALIWMILGQLSPRRAPLGLTIFLWNPLVVMESALGGHNDMCMMFLALLAVWLHLRGRNAGAVAALALSALITAAGAALRSDDAPEERQLEGERLVHRPFRAGVAVAVGVTTLCARMSLNGLTMHTASSAQF